MTRRGFLDLWKCVTVLFGGAVAAPPLLYWWRSTRHGTSGEDEAWIDLGTAIRISEDAWTPRDIDVERRNRWRTQTAREKLYLKREGESFQVVSSICPHTGCLVRQQDEGFTCPCHRSYFDSDGRVVEGPSPRPLDTLEWKVEKRKLKVRYQRFRPGMADKRVIEG